MVDTVKTEEPVVDTAVTVEPVVDTLVTEEPVVLDTADTKEVVTFNQNLLQSKLFMFFLYLLGGKGDCGGRHRRH